MQWIDSHCHLDAAEFAHDVAQVRERARTAGVMRCVIPAVEVANFEAVRTLAHRFQDGYCLGIHPLYVPQAQESDLQILDDALAQHLSDPHLLAVGEMGLDYFVPELCAPAMRDKQEFFYRAQLQLACKYQLPVVLHVRRSADRLLKHLRALRPPAGQWRGVAHAFNGSLVQAHAFIALGLKLGFGGAVTFERATQLRQLAQSLPLSALVLETDAPDIPPHWIYTPATQRAQGIPQGRNEPTQLVGIAEAVAQLRGITLAELAKATTYNVQHAFPRWNPPLVEING
jgi:TatD DNase family protein